MTLAAAEQLMSDIWQEIQRMDREAAVDRAKADPAGNKLTRVFDGPMRWRYFNAGKDGRGWTVRFCWSTTRNAAGYFLGWRELHTPKGSTANFDVKRDQWIARKARHRCKTKALQRLEKFQAVHAS